MPEKNEIVVFLTEERTPAILVRRFAHYSLVRYTRAGIDYEVEVTNDEYDYWEDADSDGDEN